jgi:hypothetical protein
MGKSLRVYLTEGLPLIHLEVIPVGVMNSYYDLSYSIIIEAGEGVTIKMNLSHGPDFIRESLYCIYLDKLSGPPNRLS